MLQQVERWLIHPELASDWRTRFFIRTWGYGLAFGVVFGVFAFTQGLWWLVLAQGYLVLAAVSCLLVVKLVPRLSLATNLSLAVVAPFISFAGLLQNPPNPMAPVFLVLLPLLASFMLSVRERRLWLGIAVVLGTLSEWLMATGHHLGGPLRAHHGVVTALNLAALMVLVVSFVSWFDGMRIETLARLEAASRARTIFLANVSHEIRTPMNGVLGLTELVLAGPLSGEQRQKIELVKRSGETLITLIDDLLLVTRAESGRLVLSPAPLLIGKVVADVVELFAPVAHEKRLSLKATIDPGVPSRVELDGVRWRQVLTNLISNALKFTERGEVAVRLEANAGRLVLTVKDEGMGIDPRVMARLFRPFEQADDSTTRRFGGSGLGLALSRQLVEAMGGTLTVTSESGRGSLFTVDVPLVNAPDEPVSEPIAPDVQHSTRPVLVVDDNPINLLVARGLVERAGFTVQVARNGREAVDAVLRHEFALVLMDCQMPEMDGLEATRLIRAGPCHAATPIVALTASGLPEELAACRDAGMDDCLVKPVSLAMLRRALALAR
ncbi:MAG: ATP-binding protein [Archangium sp.]|nr:ATP-binding protein [Archangium sp.]